MTVYRPEERRLVLRLMAYWDDLRGERDYPRADEVDPAAIGDDWAACLLLRLDGPADRAAFVHVGAALHPGVETTGLRLGELPADALLTHAAGFLDRVLDKQVPVSLGGEAETPSGTQLFRSILLPLSDDGRTIDHVLGAANGRPVAVHDDESGSGAGAALESEA
jgi:hypothetical protein